MHNGCYLQRPSGRGSSRHRYPGSSVGYLKAVGQLHQTKSQKSPFQQTDLTLDIRALDPDLFRTDDAWTGEVLVHYVSQPRIKLKLKSFYDQAMGEYILKAGAVFGRYHAAGMIVAHSPGHFEMDALHPAL